jgi:hypothetical protein
VAKAIGIERLNRSGKPLRHQKPTDRWISHHPLAQLFQPILRTPPLNAVVPKSKDHGAQQYVHEQAGADRM